MDGDSITDEPSKDDDHNPSLTETFITLCPSYMAMGMTYDEFWNRNTKVHKAYRIAWEQKLRHRNYEMWRQGMYIYDALLKVSPVMRAAFSKTKVEPGEYPSEPYPLTEKEAQEREERERVARLKRFMATLQKESEGANRVG